MGGGGGRESPKERDGEGPGKEQSTENRKFDEGSHQHNISPFAATCSLSYKQPI